MSGGNRAWGLALTWPSPSLPPQDAPETIEKVLRTEQDVSTKRNAFAMLASHAQDRAVRFLFENLEQVSTWGDILQMGVLELIRKVRAAWGSSQKGTAGAHVRAKRAGHAEGTMCKRAHACSCAQL